jgi:hypothetical protein
MRKKMSKERQNEKRELLQAQKTPRANMWAGGMIYFSSSSEVKGSIAMAITGR